MSGSLTIPKHIAIIMDGNGRWAKKRHLPRIAGHKQGLEAVKRTVQACSELSVEYLTLYAFSSENWLRPQEEVIGLMNLLRYALTKEVDILHKNNVKIRFIGHLESIADDIVKEIEICQKLTENNSGLNLVIALNYGSRDEITQAVKQVVNQVQLKNLDISRLTNQQFSEFLYTANIPDPDLLIRTSGEERVSNFLLWQLAYTELYFCDTLWPDFSKEELIKAIETFSKRERRYGAA